MNTSQLLAAIAATLVLAGCDPGDARDSGDTGTADAGADAAPAPDAGPPPFRPDGVVVLASGEDHPNGLVADADAVYWVNARSNGGNPSARSSIRRLDLQTQTITTLVADAGRAFRVFADDDDLFYGTGDETGRIFAVSKRGGVSRLLVEGAGDGVNRLAVDDERVYFSSLDPSAGNQVIVRSVRKDGSEPREHGRIDSPIPLDVVVDDENVYVTGNSVLYAIDKVDASRVVPVRSGFFGEMTNLAQDDLYLYQTNRVSDVVERVLKTGASEAAEVLSAQQPVPGRLVVGDGTLYWACRGTTGGGSTTWGTVMRLDLDGGAPEVVANGLNHAAEVAVLPEAIVWTTIGSIGVGEQDGTIMAAPR